MATHREQSLHYPIKFGFPQKGQRRGSSHPLKMGEFPSRQRIYMKQIYTDSNVIELSQNYSTLQEFRNACPYAYKYAARNGMLPKLTWLERARRPKGTLSYRFCRQAALQFSTTREFREQCTAEYVTSANNGWLKKFKWLARMDHKWDRKTVTGIARQYNTLREFRREHNGAYHYAVRQGLLDSFRWLKRVRHISKSNKRS